MMNKSCKEDSERSRILCTYRVGRGWEGRPRERVIIYLSDGIEKIERYE